MMRVWGGRPSKKVRCTHQGALTPHLLRLPLPWRSSRPSGMLSRVSQGRALPSKMTIIAPNPALVSPPPQAASSLLGPGPSGALTPGVRRAITVACEKGRGGVVPSRHSPCHSKPAPHPTPQSHVPAPAVPVRPTPMGTGVGQAATEPPPCPSRGSSLRCLCLQGKPGGNLGKSLMHRGLPPRHNFGKTTASSLGRGNGLPQSVSLCQREIHCTEGPSPA